MLPGEVAACWNTEATPQAKADFTGQGKRNAEVRRQRAEVFWGYAAWGSG
jgi:hypothetical protein